MSSRERPYYKTHQLYPTSSEARAYDEEKVLDGWGAPLPPSPVILQTKEKDTLKVAYKLVKGANSGAPEVWGPSFWFSMHHGAAAYPKKASPLWRERMKSFIHGIPVMVPCDKCADHACAYIEKRKDDLDEVVKNSENLSTFFVEFHNFVNGRLGKPQMSLEDARKMYGGSAEVLTIEYGPP